MGSMTYSQAALQILQDAAEPLTTQEIVDEALRRRLVAPKGKTPVATMAAILYVSPPKGVVRIFKKGRVRARRGSVRWSLR